MNAGRFMEIVEDLIRQADRPAVREVNNTFSLDDCLRVTLTGGEIFVLTLTDHIEPK